MVTRPKGQAEEFCRRLERLGASVVRAPAIRICPPASWKKADAALKRLDQYVAVVFTSVNAVDAFFRRLRGARKLRGKAVFAVGPATARAVRARGGAVRLVPPVATVESLAKEMSRRIGRGERVLHPCGDLANPLLRRKFRCDDVVVYRIRAPKRRMSAKALKGADFLTFASSETVRRFSASAGRAARRVPAVCIGPVTAAAARKAGYRVAATARPHTAKGLVDAVVRAAKKTRS